MAETSHDVQRELEVTRERVGNTIAALERKVNPKYWLEEYPLPAVGVAFGAGVLLGSTGADRTIARNTAQTIRTQLHSAREGAQHVMGALGAGAYSRRGDGAREGGARLAQPSVAGRDGHGAFGDTVERLTEAATTALLSAGTAKLMQLMDSMAGAYIRGTRQGYAEGYASSPSPSTAPLPRGTLAGNRW